MDKTGKYCDILAMLACATRILVTFMTALTLVAAGVPVPAAVAHASGHCATMEMQADSHSSQDAPAKVHEPGKIMCCSVACPANVMPVQLAWHVASTSHVQLPAPTAMIGRLRAPPETPPPNV